MEEILKICNDLAFALKKAIAREDERAQVNTKKEAVLDGRETVISEKENSLSAREKAILKIEDVVKLKEDAIALRKDAERLIAKTQDEKASNDKVNADQKAENARVKAENEKETARLLDEKKSIDKAWKQVRAKEASYREDVKKEVLGKLK